MENRIDRIKKQLHSSSYKLTPQREATVRVLLENEEDHLSAEDVYLLVKEKSPEIGLATVYRTLELLTELKVVDKINFGDGVSRYDLRKEGAAHFHHHLVCMECGTVDEIEDDLLEDVEEIIERGRDPNHERYTLILCILIWRNFFPLNLTHCTVMVLRNTVMITI